MRFFKVVVAAATAVAAAGGISAATMSAGAATSPSGTSPSGAHQAGRPVHDGSGRPRPVTCHSGDILTGFYGTVTVPAGNYCELLQATVDGDVIAQNGAIQLGIDNSQIIGTVEATGVTDNGWICGSRIRGDVRIQNSASSTDTSTSPGAWDIGFADPNFCGGTSFDPVPGNAIEGSLLFSNNNTAGEIANNDIEGNLACTNNTPPPTGSANSVDGTATGQCAGMGGGVDNDTTSPGDND